MRIATKITTLIFSVLLVLPSLPAQENPSGPEKILFDSANRERRALGIAPLRWDDALAAAARRHAETMAQHNAISHQFPGEVDFSRRAGEAGARFSAVDENVAVGPDAGEIHGAWMKSPGHRRNLLDPNMNSLGVAVARRDGQLFAVEDFDHALGALSLLEQEKRVGAQLQAMQLILLQDSEEARRACAMGSKYQLTGEPQLLFRYSTSNLDELPAQLQQKIRSGQYRKATVGACPSQNDEGFASYWLAVILK
jgi:hypothetical protein